MSPELFATVEFSTCGIKVVIHVSLGIKPAFCFYVVAEKLFKGVVLIVVFIVHK